MVVYSSINVQGTEFIPLSGSISGRSIDKLLFFMGRSKRYPVKMIAGNLIYCTMPF